MTSCTVVSPGSPLPQVPEGSHRYLGRVIPRHPTPAAPSGWRTVWNVPFHLGLVYLALCLGLGALLYPTPSPGAPLQDQQILTVAVNKSRILDLREPIARVSVANPAIADILVINPKQVYVNGKELGSTNMILWGDQDQILRQIGLEVTHDIESLKEKLYRLLPGERLRVESAQGSIVLNGTVSSPTLLESVLSLAKSYGPVINLIQVGGAQQVLLEVKVAEVNRELGKVMDSNLGALYDGGSVKIGLVKGGGNFRSPGTVDGVPLPKTLNIIDSIADSGLLANIASGNFYADLFLDIAQNQGLARILAEPNLTTLSGQEADFLSGGQFPVSVEGNNGQVNTEWKDYGIQLKFIPLVLSSGVISLKVNVSVSELGPIVKTTTGDAQSVLTRGANATVEIPSGQTIAIAGLLSEDSRDSVDKFPGLGDIPILGALFRSVEFQKKQTELVILVTPKLANAFAGRQAKLPTDGFVEPSDVEFYLMGKLSGQRTPSSQGGKSGSTGAQRLGPDKQGSEGAFGHDL